MRDIWPLSDRFDLTYIGRRHFADRLIGPLSAAAAIIALAAAAYPMLRRDTGMYSSGPLTHAHAVFANDCGQCHQADPDRAGFWLPASDSACLTCHVATAHATHQSMFTGDTIVLGGATAVTMASSCATCHIEHRGAEADLTLVPDSACIQCHRDIDRLGRSAPGSLPLMRDHEAGVEGGGE